MSICSSMNRTTKDKALSNFSSTKRKWDASWSQTLGKPVTVLGSLLTMLWLSCHTIYTRTKGISTHYTEWDLLKHESKNLLIMLDPKMEREEDLWMSKLKRKKIKINNRWVCLCLECVCSNLIWAFKRGHSVLCVDFGPQPNTISSPSILPFPQDSQWMQILKSTGSTVGRIVTLLHVCFFSYILYPTGIDSTSAVLFFFLLLFSS